MCHDHCWHRIKSVSDYMGGRKITEVCCHCDEILETHHPPMKPKVYSFDRSKHGPYLPDTKPMW